ncbi:MAG: nicotinate-nucleotide adenylyltransferase [Kiritimatiellia bacterium]|nr:nicotinate-nucleotide adenylyltransferase [Kiritimatiellia bacterium]
MQSRIGIFGGTFNPAHLGHLILAQDALEAFDLARILFVPCILRPHNDAGQLASPAHRGAMLERAIEDNPDFEICDLEIRRGGTNYSIDTIRHLQKACPQSELFFIIGSDSLLELHQWKEIKELLGLCRFITLIRPGFDIKMINEQKLKLEPEMGRDLLKNVVAVHQIDISSSDIRHRVAEGMNIRYLVPNAVEMYIAEHNLYRT